MDRQYQFQDFLKIIAQLRSPEGCPWDREQTLESLKSCLVKESAEAVAAVNIYSQTGDSENLCEELGDLLLQIVLQSQIAKEKGLFTIEDVIQTVSEKMIRRHPHVFQEDQADSSEEVIAKWEEIKKKEKAGLTPQSVEIQKKALEEARQEILRILL